MIYKEECYKIIGICMEIHRELGKGFKEVVYKDAMEIEFRKVGILFEREKKYTIDYKGEILPHKYIADFVAYDKIILEVKAIIKVPEEFVAQTLNYLAVSKCRLGMIINFGTTSLEYKRIVL